MTNILSSTLRVVIRIIAISILVTSNVRAEEFSYTVARIEITDPHGPGDHILFSSADPSHITDMLVRGLATCTLIGNGKLDPKNVYKDENRKKTIAIANDGSLATPGFWCGYSVSLSDVKPLTVHLQDSPPVQMSAASIVLVISEPPRPIEHVLVGNVMYIKESDENLLSETTVSTRAVIGVNTPAHMVVPLSNGSFIYLRISTAP